MIINVYTWNSTKPLKYQSCIKTAVIFTVQNMILEEKPNVIISTCSKGLTNIISCVISTVNFLTNFFINIIVNDLKLIG